jgi:hypothetical protein
MTAVAAGRVKLAFNPVQGNKIASVLEFPVGAFAVTDRRFHFYLVGVAVSAEGTFVTGGTEPVIRRSVETVTFDE